MWRAGRRKAQSREKTLQTMFSVNVLRRMSEFPTDSAKRSLTKFKNVVSVIDIDDGSANLQDAHL